MDERDGSIEAPATSVAWSEAAATRPWMLLRRKQRDRFDEAYRLTLDRYQAAFNRFVRLTNEEEKLAVANSLKDRVAAIVRYDTLRDVLSDSDPLWTVVIPPIIVCFLTPMILAGTPSLSAIVPGAVGLVIAIIIALAIIYLLTSSFVSFLVGRPSASDLLPLLAYTAIIVGALWAVLTTRPFGYEAYSAGLAGSVVFCGLFFLLVGFIPNALTVVIDRLKIAKDPEGEIIETLLATLYVTFMDSSAHKLLNFRTAAEYLQYVASIIDATWREFVPKRTNTVVSLRWQSTMARVAAGLRSLGSRAAFPDADFGNVLSKSLSIELTAFVTGNYGNLLVAEPDSADSVKPTILRILRGVGSLVAAVTPIALVLLIPRIFDVELDKSLFGTLLTISLGWLVLYIVNWLDPKSNAKTGALPGIAGLVTKGGG